MLYYIYWNELIKKHTNKLSMQTTRQDLSVNVKDTDLQLFSTMTASSTMSSHQILRKNVDHRNYIRP